ncbi:MAG: FlgD immunoglobulin-like domain containing protein [Flavobacteriales bacterium]
MNKQYITAFAALFLAGGAVAQIPRAELPKGKAPKMIPVQGGSANGVTKGACILSEDFESTTLSALIGAGWDDGAQIETQDDNTGAGTGTFVDAWTIGVASDANNGGYLPIPDDPTLNKLIFVNDDGDPCNCDMTDVGLVTPVMDFTGFTQMTVGFRAYSDENFGGGDATVSASTDGGTTWTTVHTVAAVEAEWQDLVVDLGAYDGMSSVRLRFAWTDGGSWATGFAIDDICVAPIVPNNLALVKMFTENVTLGLNDLAVRSIEYSKIPLEQVQSVNLVARVTNNGGTAQTNVVASAEVFFDGASQGTFSSAAVASMDPGDTLNLVINTGWTPTAPGAIDVDMSVAADQVDDAPGNNNRSKSFEVSGPAVADGSNVWARDKGAAASFSGGTDQYSVANLFESMPAGSTVYGIGVCFGAADEGSVVQAQLLDATFTVIEMAEYEIPLGFTGNNVGEGTFTYIPLDAPATLNAADDVAAALTHFGGTNVRSANSGTSADTTSFFDDGTGWGWVTFTPMVRLFLGNAVGVPELEENGVTLGANMPNPFNGNTAVQYSLSDARKVSFEVRDIEGRVVHEVNLGTMGAGKHLIDFDARNLADGSYTYTLIAGEDRLTRSMVLAH